MARRSSAMLRTSGSEHGASCLPATNRRRRETKTFERQVINEPETSEPRERCRHLLPARRAAPRGLHRPGPSGRHAARCRWCDGSAPLTTCRPLGRAPGAQRTRAALRARRTLPSSSVRSTGDASNDGAGKGGSGRRQPSACRGPRRKPREARFRPSGVLRWSGRRPGFGKVRRTSVARGMGSGRLRRAVAAGAVVGVSSRQSLVGAGVGGWESAQCDSCLGVMIRG